jgi:hypothetical protein
MIRYIIDVKSLLLRSVYIPSNQNFLQFGLDVMCVHSLILGWPDYGVVWRGSALRVPMPEPEPLCRSPKPWLPFR